MIYIYIYTTRAAVLITRGLNMAKVSNTTYQVEARATAQVLHDNPQVMPFKVRPVVARDIGTVYLRQNWEVGGGRGE